MTRPAPWRRSTAADRRRWRQEFRELKERVAANPSPEHLARLEKYRCDAARERCQGKIARALAGVGIRPFSPAEAARIKPAEIAMLREEVANRMGRLTAEQRTAFGRNSWLAVLSFTPEQLAAIASLP